jgi:NADH:ubiquinone oxidoreductase subunit 6 (subunit J)
MSIDWFRDLIICIFGVMATVAILLITILVVSLYRKSRAVLQSAEATSKNIQEITSSLRKKFISPVTGMGVFLQGIYKGVEAINKIFRKREGGKHNG